MAASAKQPVRVLAGDVGGTKTLLQLAEFDGNACRAIFERRFDSGAYGDFGAVIREFLQAVPAAPAAPLAIHSACFGVAGPIRGQTAKITNLPWQIDAGAIGTEFAISRVRLINDFAAVGHGIETLSGADLVTLQAGQPQPGGVRAVIGAGTGLGMGLLVWRDDCYEALPSEGGHVDFAPADEEQIALLRYLKPLYGRVSCERVVSGPGLVKIYEFLRDTGGADESPELRHAMLTGDAAAAVSEAALAERDALAVQALDLFVSIYGAVAGNLALTLLAGGGVYIAGGIAPKILDRLKAGGFMHAFNAKGRFAELASNFPVHVVTNPKVGLQGAALVASRM
jgi:glucokinase